MEERELVDAKIIPINKYVLCQAEKKKESSLVMPDLETVSSPLQVLVVKHIAKDCEIVKVGDIIIIGPLAKSQGTISDIPMDGAKILMVKETDVAFILRRETKDDTQSN